MVAVLGYRLFFIEELFKVSKHKRFEIEFLQTYYRKLVPLVHEHGSSVSHALFIWDLIGAMNMRQKNKKNGYSCYDKKTRGFENPKEKLKRLIRNIKFAYQRIKYGYCDSDVWSIDTWFLNVMPGMLQQLKETSHSYPNFEGSMSHVICSNGMTADDNNAGVKQWEKILSEMIFLLNEANEDTCTKENKYEKEYLKVKKEFDDKYGIFGEKLRTEEEIEKEKKTGVHRVYMVDDIPEYKGISELYYNESKSIDNYRNECKDKAFELLSKWFWNLWD